MASAESWKDDEGLAEDLRSYVCQNFHRSEILDFMLSDYPWYKWSTATLDRQLRFFEIFYIDVDTSVDTVKEAVEKEINGPGKLLGYRLLNQKLRNEHKIKGPRHLVLNVMRDIDPDGIESRRIGKKLQMRKRPFISDGPGWLFSLDGHDKLMGFRNCTFPVAIYGCMDTFSRYINFLFVWDSNSNPHTIGLRYIEHLHETRKLPFSIRMDHGTETGKLAAIHAFLRGKIGDMEDAAECVVYGPSTSNKIERWWRDLHEKMEIYFTTQLSNLLQRRCYDPNCITDRRIMAYIFIPVVQRECDVFKNLWNAHRIRHQQGLEVPTGVPSHMFQFPESYGGEDKSFSIDTDSIREAAEVSGVLDAPSYYIEEDLKSEFCKYLPYPEKIDCSKVAEAFTFLKQEFRK